MYNHTIIHRHVTESRRALAGLFVVMAFFACEAAARAQLPSTQLEAVFPCGGNPGATFEVVVGGQNLDDVNQLRFSHPGITAVQKMAEPTPFDPEPQPVENTFLVTVTPEVPVGTYDIRCQGKYGLSNSRRFLISRQTEVKETEPNNEKKDAQLIALPCILHGQSQNGPDVDWFQFEGTAGQRLQIDGYASRIDSLMDVSFTLIRDTGEVVSEHRRSSSGEVFTDVVLPVTGRYLLKVHDALYGQGPGYQYRLQLGSVARVEFIMPPAGVPGSQAKYTIYGTNLPGSRPSSYQIEGLQLEELDVQIAMPAEGSLTLNPIAKTEPHQAFLDGFYWTYAEETQSSNPVLLTTSPQPLIPESANDTASTPQQLSLPCELAGQFYPQRDMDWFVFEMKKDERWIFEVLSQRLGIPSDPALLIQQKQVSDKGEVSWKEIQFLDDLPEKNINNRAGRHEFDERTADPYFVMTAPADGTYRLLLKEGLSSVRSDPRLVYRLSIRRPAPDFRLIAVPQGSTGATILRRGSREMIHLVVDRRDGFEEDIRVTVAGLPAGVTAEEISIGRGNDAGTLILTTASDAPVATGAITITGTASVNGQPVSREARYGMALRPFQFNQANANVPSVPSRIVASIEVCVTDIEPIPVQLTIGDGTMPETSRGGVVKIPWTLKKGDTPPGNLTGLPINYPPNTNAQQFNIGSNEKGEFEIRFQANTPPGTYSVVVAAFNQGYNYSRNPEAAEKARQRADRIAAVLKDAQKTTQDMQTEQQKRQTELNTANSELSKANQQKQQSDQALSTADGELAKAMAAFKEKTDASAANPSDENLKQQVTQAQQALEAAQKKRDEMKLAAENAAAKLEEATSQQKVAQEARTQIDVDLQKAREFQQKAQQENQRAEQFANQKKNEANPRGINIHVPSNPVLIRVTEFPLQVKSCPDAVTVRQGEKTEIPVEIERLYDFKSAVNLQMQATPGVAGVNLSNGNVPEGQPAGKLELTAQSNAALGSHAFTLRLQMNFNGQNLVMERPIQVTITEAAAEPKQ